MRLTKDLVIEIEDRFIDLFRGFRKEWAKISNNEINRNEFTVLAMLHRGAMKASDISNELKVSPSHISIITESLVKNELVIRMKCLEDRRIVRFKITEKGQQLVSEVQQRKRQLIQNKFSEFNEEELKIFLSYLNRLSTPPEG